MGNPAAACPDLADQAAAYALVGWPVFPLVPNGKVPLYSNPHPRGSAERGRCRGECGQYGHGVLDATLNLDVIAVWWRRTPTANVAIATGAPGPDVVDVDVKNDSPGHITIERLRRAGLIAGHQGKVITASGGWHLYYEGTRQSNSTMRALGIDFRGLGGYVVAPPSVVDGRAYLWDQIRLAETSEANWAAIRDFLRPRASGPPPDRSRRGGRVEQLADWVSGQHEGNRNAGLYWAALAALESTGGHANLRELQDAAIANGLGAIEAQRTTESARRHYLAGER